MTLKRPARPLTALLLFAAILLSAGSLRAQPLKGVLKVGDQRGGAKALMEAAGVLEGVPYTIEWSLFAGAPMLLEAINAGAIDTGSVGDAPLVSGLAAHIPIKAVAVVQSDAAVTALVVGKNFPIHTVEDLKGRSIATLRGQTGHFLTLAALERAGLPLDSVKFVFLTPVDAKAALTGGSVDGWATWGPYISLAKIRDGAREVVNGRGLMSGLSFQIATDTAIASRRPLLTDFLIRLRQARDWGQAHPEEQAKVWGEQTGFPPDVATDVVRTSNTRSIPIDDAVVAAEQRVADFLVTTKVFPQPVDVRPSIDRSFNEAVFRP
jgi:sulfonate transport system substrate-binding protein